MNKKNLFYWALYDFANSFVFINFLVYFSQWLVIDGGLSDFWYNSTYAISSIILLLTAPTLASFTDKFGNRKQYLKFSTFGTLIFYSLATIFAYLNINIWLIALSFLIGQYFYQLSFSFHNPLIKDISSDKKDISKISGIGQFSNSLGQVFGLILALFFSKSRLAPLFPSISIFLILSIPMILWFKENKVSKNILTINDFSNETKSFYKKFILFMSVSVAVPMLVSFFFFNDALITVSNNYSIYLEQVFKISDNLKNIIMMAILIMGAIGGLTFGQISSKIGNLKSLKIILGSWIILLPFLGILKSINGIIVASVLLGFFMGGIWSVSRSYLLEKLNENEVGYGFSFYSLFERFATFLGPLTWGGIIALFGNEPNVYRFTMIFMTLYVIVGFILLSKWKRKTIDDRV
jgi:UMF1 family MFS transporter